MGLIIPAIDLLGGQAVRLYKGDYDQKTVYSDNPVEIAQKFKDMGAKIIHIVDLDGAKSGNNPNFEVIKEIAKVIDIEVGGGIRNADIVEQYLKVAKRVILGTVAVKDPQFVIDMVNKYGKEKIVVGVDVKDGKVAVHGWTEKSELDYLEFIDTLPCDIIIVTDISKDGTLKGPNWEMYKQIKNKRVIVSGGVASDADLDNPYYGTIVGKAYYEGKVDLEACLKKESSPV